MPQTIRNTKINTQNFEETLKLDIRRFAISVNLVCKLGYKPQGTLQRRMVWEEGWSDQEMIVDIKVAGPGNPSAYPPGR